MARVYEHSEITKPFGFLHFVEPHSRILEFGTATGYFTRYMKEKLHCTITGVELIPEVATQATPFTEKMIVANIDEDEWEKEIDGFFDYVIFGDVLEHLRYPKQAIEKAIPFLKENGYILTSTPNITHNTILLNLRKNKFDYQETGLLDNTHVHFFTRSSLFSMFNSLNFTSVEEKSAIVRPCNTEFHNYYCSSPLISLSIIRKKDGHVYQFTNKWGGDKSTGNQEKKWVYHRLSILEVLFEICIDIATKIYRNLPSKWKNKIK